MCWLNRTILVGTVDGEVFEVDIETETPTLLLQVILYYIVYLYCIIR